VTNSLRLPLLSLVAALALFAIAAATTSPEHAAPLNELGLGAVGVGLALAVFGIQGIISVALEGRQLRPGIAPPHLTNPLSAGVVIVSLLLFVDAVFLGYGIVSGQDTTWLGIAAAFGCLCLAVVLIFYKEAFLGDEACFDDREDGIPW
jgi:NO-binding membrane sensor protein with MHYT domain